MNNLCPTGANGTELKGGWVETFKPKDQPCMISSQIVIQDNLIKVHTTQVHFSCEAVKDIRETDSRLD